MTSVLLKSGDLLDEKGRLEQRGYATSLVLKYHRSRIKAASYRIKEWDYYLIHNDNYGIALTVADNSYLGALSVSFLDFRSGEFITQSRVIPFTFGKFKMPETSVSGELAVHRKGAGFIFSHENGKRRLKVKFDNFYKGNSFECNILLTGEPKDSMVIATPFAEDEKAFYYNQKINCMKSSGTFQIGEKEYVFEPDDAVGLLDWGRGVWTYDNIWYWGSASGYQNGESLGFNIGYGFGDTSAASENMVFYKGKAHKLSEIAFHIPQKDGAFDYLSPWKFTSDDGRFEMDFEPVMDRKDYVSFGIIKTDQHQVFGRFTGTIILDDGQKLEVKNLLGFAERVANKW